MADPRAPSSDEEAGGAGGAEASTEDLRRQVEETYDFEDFGPREMAEMSPEEWEAAFDADSWITGPDLIERVAADLRTRIENREVFARLERVEDGLLAYSDEGYAVVRPDGSVEGRGTVLRDVKPTVALCSMEDYTVGDPPEGELLPEPEDVPEGSGELGNWMLQFVALTQLLVGLGLFVAWIAGAIPNPSGDTLVLPPVVGLLMVLFSLLLFVQVANARLSDKFRSEEYRDRLRAVGIGSEGRPAFLPEEYREEQSASPLTGDEHDRRPREPTAETDPDDSSPST